MLTIDKTDERDPEFQRGYRWGIDGEFFPDEGNRNILFRKGFLVGQADRGDVNKRLDRLAQRYDSGEFRAPGEYLAKVTEITGGSK